MAAATVAGMKPSALFRFVVAFMFVEVPELVEGAASFFCLHSVHRSRRWCRGLAGHGAFC